MANSSGFSEQLIFDVGLGTVRRIEVREHPPIDASKILDPMIEDLLTARTPDLAYQTPILPPGALVDYKRDTYGHLIIAVPAYRGSVSFDKLRNPHTNEIADVATAELVVDVPPVILDFMTSGNGLYSVRAYFVKQKTTIVTMDTPLYDTWMANIFSDERGLCLGSTLSMHQRMSSQQLYDDIGSFVRDFYGVYYNDDLPIPRHHVPVDILKLCDNTGTASGIYEGWATWTQINENKQRIWEIEWPSNLPQTTLRQRLRELD